MKRFCSVALAVAALALFATPALADNGTNALKAAPANTVMALHFNAKRLSKSPLFQEVMAQAKQTQDVKKGLAEMEAKLGFNPERDLEGVTVLVPTDISGGGKPTIIVTGSFNVAKAEAEIKGDKKFTIKTLGGQKAYVGKDGMAMVFSKSRVVFAPAEAIGNVVLSKGGVAALSSLSNTVDRSKDVWFAANIDDKMRQSMGANPMIKDLKTLRGSLDLAKGLGLNLNVGVATAATATNLAKMGQMQLDQGAKDPAMGAMGMGGFISKIAIAAKGTDVAVDLNLNQAEVNQLKMMAMMMTGMGAAAGAKAAPAAAPKK